MANITILVARDIPALRSVANDRGLQIVEATIVEFSSISTETDDVFSDAGDIESGKTGAACFAQG